MASRISVTGEDGRGGEKRGSNSPNRGDHGTFVIADNKPRGGNTPLNGVVGGDGVVGGTSRNRAVGRHGDTTTNGVVGRDGIEEEEALYWSGKNRANGDIAPILAVGRGAAAGDTKPVGSGLAAVTVNPRP